MTPVATEAAFGGVEAGGTKFTCVIGTGPGDIAARAVIPTTSPRETLDRVARFFADSAGRKRLLGVGVASFGPVDIRRDSPTYGYILGTPKSQWQNVDLLGAIVDATGDSNPAFDTDVNGSALAEYLWGATQDVDPLVYITVGTGIGGGAIVNAHPLHGRVHPEMGHLRLPLDPRDTRPGCCPYHGACLEGLASGRAIAERYGADPRTIPDGHIAWTLTTEYLALGIANVVLTLAPRRVVVGGGVSRRIIWPLLYERLDSLLASYPAPVAAWAEYVMPPRLGDDAGPLGPIALARVQSEGVTVRPARSGDSGAVPARTIQDPVGNRQGAH